MWLFAVLLLAADTTHASTVVVAPAESLAVYTTGHGSPVVLLPGLFGSAFGFRKVVPLLTADGYQTIAIEPLGIGHSSRPKDADYSLTAQAHRIGAVLDSLHIKHAVIVAHSLGGSEAFRLTWRRPDLVTGIVSLEGGPTESTMTPAFAQAMRFAPLLKVIGGIDLVRWNIAHMLKAASGNPGWITDSVIRGYTDAAARDLGGTLDAYKAMAIDKEPELLRPHLDRITCPVIMLVGGAKHDGDVDPNEVVLLHHVLPHFEVDTIPGAGHFLQEERPAVVRDAVQRLETQLASAGKARH